MIKALKINKLNKLKSKLFLVFMVGMCYNLWAQVQEQRQNGISTQKALRVGVAGSEPFVFNKSASGISVDIWNEIAESKSWDFQYIPFKTVDGALHALNSGTLDLVVGPISITSKRLEYMRFSQPFYNSSISIISRTDSLTFWEKIKPFFSMKLFLAVGVFLVILAFVGMLFWLAERKKSPDQFSQNPINGIGSGMWLAVVTMSTTGYGDKAPITVMGRIIAGTWMVISIIFATSMVAGIASTLTLSTISATTVSNIEELSGGYVSTISGSPSELFLTKEGIKVRGVANLNEAVEKLNNRDVEAVIYDRPQLLYFLKNNNHDNLYISKAEYYKQGYGIAFPLNSKLVLDVNRTLLGLAENQELDEIIHTYIEKDE